MTSRNCEPGTEEVRELSTEELNSVTGGDSKAFFTALTGYSAGQGAVAGAVNNGVGALIGQLSH